MLKIVHNYNYLSTVRIHDRDLKSLLGKRI